MLNLASLFLALVKFDTQAIVPILLQQQQQKKSAKIKMLKIKLR